MSPIASLALRGNAYFPRVSGDEPLDPSRRLAPTSFSPRERG